MVPQGLANLGGQYGACRQFRCEVRAGMRVGEEGKEEEPHWRCPWQPRGGVVCQHGKKGNALRYLGSKGCQGPKGKPRGQPVGVVPCCVAAQPAEALEKNRQARLKLLEDRFWVFDRLPST